MWLRHAPYVILLIIASTQTISCQEKGSLTYVIDNTLSMTDDIEQVKMNTDKITRTVFEKSSSQIQNMVLVTFNDPYADLETITDDKDDFKAKINQVNVHNNYGNPDCQEMSLTGILLALENSLPRSFIYVFTDASAKDYEKSSQIQKMCQEKQTQIVFVLTGFCKWDRYKPSFQVYYDIAAACSGLAFVVGKHEVSSIFTPIEDAINGKKGMITSKTIPAYTLQIIPFDVDDNTEYVRVEAAGFDVTLSVKGPKPHAKWWTYYKKKLTWLPNIKVLLLTRLTPGRYSATVYGFSRTTVNIIGNSDFSFELGFSESETTTLKDTTAQPVANSSTHLFISVSDPNKAMNIQSASILDMDEKVIANYNIPLTRINNNFYSTPLFTAPSKMFKIAVYGKSNNTGKLIRRLARFPITPQPAKKKPVVSVAEGASIITRYGQSLSLTCNVTAYPEPAIEWTDSRQNVLRSRITVTKVPYNYASFLTIPEVTDNEIYSCHATNDIGADNRTINVMVEDPFHIHSPLNDSMHVQYGAKATLKCHITASQPINISWTFVDINKRVRRQIRSSEYYSLSTDGSTLKIKKMTTDTVGTYTCIATLHRNKNKFKSHSTEVRLVGLTLPKITSDSSTVYRSIEGQDRILIIPCTATGLPKPTITWKLGNRILRQSFKYLLGDGFIVINNPTVEDTATYVCHVQNDAGSVSASFRAQILQVPWISGDTTKTVVVGSSTSIKCLVTKGVPVPTMSWQFMVNNQWKSIEFPDSQNVLRIPRVSEVNAGRYKCIAKNIVGSVEHVTVLIVQEKPVVSIAEGASIITRYGQSLSLTCNVTAYPEPAIEWTDSRQNVLRSRITVTKVPYNYASFLTIPEVTDNEIYSCHATNDIGADNRTINVMVEDPFHIHSPLNDSMHVQYGAKATLKCHITASQPINISWTFVDINKRVRRQIRSSEYYSLSTDGSTLKIKKMTTDTVGTYTCIATLHRNKNKFKSHSTEVRLVGLTSPKITSDSSTVYRSIEGQDRILIIPCTATGLPKPTITWKLGNRTLRQSSKYLLGDGFLVINNPTVEDTATYVCHVQNDAGSVSASFRAQILQVPWVIGDTTKTVVVGSSTSIECIVTKGVPVPTMSWQFMVNNQWKSIEVSDSQNVLRIPRVSEVNAGRYKCIAKNIVGSAEHVTVLIVQASPKITSDSSTIYKSIEGKDRILKIPCTATGLPKPTITWQLGNRILRQSAKYSFEDDALVVKNPAVEDTGSYICSARNVIGSTSISFNAEILQIPKTSNEITKIVRAGSSTDIKCMVVKGVPPPTISWQFMGDGELKFRKLVSSDSVIHISPVGEKDAGRYKCTAHNIVGDAEHITVLNVKVPPVIISDNSTVYKAIEGQDKILKIPCKATGLPKPIISWRTRNGFIPSNEKYSFEDDALIIKGPTTNDSGSYVCVATNEAGSNSFPLLAQILQVPQMVGETSKTAKVGMPLNIECTIVKGVPTPTITWQFKAKDKSKFQQIKISDNVLRLSTIGAEDAGHYKCIAHNIIGDAEHVTDVIVQVPPIITSGQSLVYKAVETQDATLRLPCKATGLPKPNVTWTLGHKIISPDSKYSFESEDLIIKNPMVNDTASYFCTATNEAGSSNVSIETQILQIPQVTGETSKIVKVGMSLDINCIIVKGVPTPKITWQFRAKDKSKFEQIKGSDNVLHISTVGEENAGHYKCIAHNTIGDAEHINNVIVQVPPIITSGKSSVYKAVETQDATLRLPCKATGLPKPNVTWTLGHKIISPDTKYSFESGDLIIKNPVIDDAATYVCTASNDAGTSNVSVKAQILQIPQTSSETLMTVTVGSSTSIKCIVAKGVPAPTITWQFKSKGVTNFIQLANSDHVLHIPRVGEKDAGRYKCIAHNIVGDAEHVTILTVQVPPMITSNYSTVYTIVEEQDKALRIPCTTSGLPKPTITWTVKQETISPSVKYSFEDDTLIIKDPFVNDTGTYVCTAKNDAGSVNASFHVQIHQMPQISGETLKIVRAGNVLDIKCVIVKGVPAPKITWQFMAKNESKFVQIPGSDNVLHISAATEGNAGRYKCIAENVLGVAEHVTTIVVQFAPVVITNISKAFEGLEGDVALRIPCDVIGVPTPVISWSVNGTAISTNAHYSVTDGALIIISPKNNDTGSYRCEAFNYLGSVNVSFNAIVKEELDDDGKIEQIKINKVNRTSFKLECGSPGQSVRWFIEGIDTKINGNYFELYDFDAAYNGNYTCRVSDISGAYTKTYHVKIGSPPEFAFAQEETTLDWTGNDKNVLDCSVGLADKAKIEWTYNGEVLSENTTSSLGVIRKWGQYTCNVSNDFGAIQRTFDVISSFCLIPRNPNEYGFMPLILNEDDTWPTLRTTSKYFTFESGDEIKLSCPNYETKRNSLRNFPALQEIIAKCDKQDIFIVQGKRYKVYDLGCDHAIIPTVVNKNEKCSPDPSNKISVGYNVSTFLETYEVCLDLLHNMPLYSSIIMPNNYHGEKIKNIWYMHPAINFTTNDEVYTCENSASTCCYSKTQLMSAEYVIDGPAQNTTFIDTINEVPLWRPCNETKLFWNYVDEQLRFQLNLVPAFIIWSGVHAFQNQNGHLVPRYLFKLVEFIEDSPIAIVYVNGPSPTAADVLCKNICADGDQIWLEDLSDHVYCCTGDDFREAFQFYPETISKYNITSW